MDESIGRNTPGARILLVSLFMIAFTLTVQGIPVAPVYPSSHLPIQPLLASPSIQNATIAVNPAATEDLARTMTTLTVAITIDNATSEIMINGYEVLLAYNPKVLTAASINFDNSILYSASNSLVIVKDCLDGNPAPGQGSNVCGKDDGPGYSSFAASILGATTSGLTNGELFSIKFNINTAKPAFSQIQIKSASLANGQLDPNTGKPFIIPDNTVDGYYTSIDCGGSACLPPSPSFTWSPQPAKQKLVTLFNASSSRVSPGFNITEFFWTWGDSGQSPFTDFCAYSVLVRPDAVDVTNCLLNPHLGCIYGTPNPVTGVNSTDTRSCVNVDPSKADPNHSPLNNTAQHVFQNAGAYFVTLTVRDSYNITASRTFVVNVINADIDVGIDSIDVTPQPIGALPGTVFTIVAVLKNYGGVQMNSTSVSIVLVLETPVMLNSTSVAKLRTAETATLSATWDSTGKVPNVYRVEAIVPAVTNSTGSIIETNVHNNVKSVWVQLVYPQPIGLDLLQTTGVGAVVVGVLGYVIAWLRKRSIPVEL